MDQAAEIESDIPPRQLVQDSDVDIAPSAGVAAAFGRWWLGRIVLSPTIWSSVRPVRSGNSRCTVSMSSRSASDANAASRVPSSSKVPLIAPGPLLTR